MNVMISLAIPLLLPLLAHAQQLTPDDRSNLQPDAVEAAYLRSAPRAKRDGLKLTIATSTGTVIFKDNLFEGEGYKKNSLVGFFEVYSGRVDYVVRHDYYESRSFTIVNGMNGNQTTVPGHPVLSPDQTRYLSTHLDLEAGYDPNQLVIIRADDFATEKTVLFDAAPPSGPSNPLWISPSQIFFIKQTIDKAGMWLKPMPMTIELIDGKWQEPRNLK